MKLEESQDAVLNVKLVRIEFLLVVLIIVVFKTPVTNTAVYSLFHFIARRHVKRSNMMALCVPLQRRETDKSQISLHCV